MDIEGLVWPGLRDRLRVRVLGDWIGVGFWMELIPALFGFRLFFLLCPYCWLGLLDVVWDGGVMQKRWSVFNVFNKDHRGGRLGLWMFVGSRCFVRRDCPLFTVYDGARHRQHVEAEVTVVLLLWKIHDDHL